MISEMEPDRPVEKVVLSSRSWAYSEVAAQPLPASVEDHLLSALRRLTETLDIEGVCEAVLSGVEHAFGATSSWILLHDPDAEVLRCVLFRGRGADAYGGAEIPVEQGISGLVFTRGEIQFVPDANGEGRWFNPDRVRASGIRSALVLPLIAGDKRIGVVGVDSPRFGPEHPPTQLDIRRLEIFAAQAAIGLLNARRYQASQQDRNRLRALLRERKTLRQHLSSLRDEVRHAYSFGPILGESAAMRRVLQEVEQVAESDVTVLLLGETGTGKELLARALHERSRRASRVFVPVNCAAMPENLVESEMFGHERGAFTGAHLRKPGRFELAHRGTLFLDEVGDLPLNAQAKLLRVLQDGEVNRVGGTQPTKVDVRVIAATNRDLTHCVRERSFRDDLFYRLSVFPIRLPALRQRIEDIPQLAAYFAERCATQLGKRITEIEQHALDALMAYSWPGNVRELQNVLERAVLLTRDGVIGSEMIRLDEISPPALPIAPAAEVSAEEPSNVRPSAPGAPPTFADAERAVIVEALRKAEGRVSGTSGAAALLGLKPTTLHAKMKKLGVTRADVLRS
jgi:formate hydrogenlyase transcriptional activator